MEGGGGGGGGGGGERERERERESRHTDRTTDQISYRNRNKETPL